GSNTAWYLASNMIETVEVCFLSDEPAPVLRQETDFDTEDAKLAVRHTVAAAAIDHRGLVKKPGAYAPDSPTQCAPSPGGAHLQPQLESENLMNTFQAKGQRLTYANAGSAIAAGDAVVLIDGAAGKIGVAVTDIAAST